MTIVAYVIIVVITYMLIGWILSVFDKAYDWGTGSIMVFLWLPIAYMFIIYLVVEIIGSAINFTNNLSASISKRIKKEMKNDKSTQKQRRVSCKMRGFTKH